MTLGSLTRIYFDLGKIVALADEAGEEEVAFTIEMIQMDVAEQLRAMGRDVIRAIEDTPA